MYAFSTFPCSIQGVANLASVHLPSVPHAIRRYARSQTSHLVTKKNTRLTTALEEETDKLPRAIKQHLEDVELCSAAAVLNPALQCMHQTYKKQNNQAAWQENHTSSDTFFQNKYGFSEQDLWLSVFGDQPCSVLTPKHVFSAKNPGISCFTQSRGFKTHRSSTIAGFRTGRKPEATSAINKVKLKLTGSNTTKLQNTDRLKELISSTDASPEMQSKLKIAFAEGYSASEGTRKSDKDSSTRLVYKFFLYGFTMYICYLLLFKTTGLDMKSALKGDVFKVSPEDTGVTFDDVKGADEAKQELKDVVAFLKDPDRFEAIGAKLPKGILLVGSPGIGKTLLARAVAGEADVPFFHASGSDFDEMLVGMGAKRVRNLFASAKIHAPCIIFIDEIDSVGSKRTESNIHPYANQTINQLLSEMDGYSPNEGVIVLGATNRRQTLDKALLRPGRFDMEVHIHLPDMKGRREIFQHYLDKVETDPAVDAEKLAMGTAGFSGAEIENVVNQAALKAALEGEKYVTLEHLDFARDKVLMGPAKKHRIPDEATNVNTAYHEAGHTLVAYYTKDATPIHKVTIIPRGSSLGHTSFIPDKEQYQLTKAQLLAQMDVAMGGRVAEEIIFGADKVSTGASNDFQQATAIATAMVKKYGMSERVGVRVFDEEMVPTLYGTTVPTSTSTSAKTAELLDKEIKRYLEESYERAKHILKTHSHELKALSAALMKYDTLDAKEIQSIVESRNPTLPT